MGIDKKASVSVPIAVLSRFIVDFFPNPDGDDGPHPWDPFAGEPQPIPWKQFVLARIDVERLVGEVRRQLLHIKTMSVQKEGAHAVTAIGAWIADEIDGWCGSEPIKLHIPIPKGYGLLVRGALLAQAIDSIPDAAVKGQIQQGAARLFETGFKELTAA